MNTNIMAYRTKTVKPEIPAMSKRRLVRKDIAISEIDPCYRSMARHIDKQHKRKRPIRIPNE